MLDFLLIIICSFFISNGSCAFKLLLLLKYFRAITEIIPNTTSPTKMATTLTAMMTVLVAFLELATELEADEKVRLAEVGDREGDRKISGLMAVILPSKLMSLPNLDSFVNSTSRRPSITAAARSVRTIIKSLEALLRADGNEERETLVNVCEISMGGSAIKFSFALATYSESLK